MTYFAFRLPQVSTSVELSTVPCSKQVGIDEPMIAPSMFHVFLDQDALMQSIQHSNPEGPFMTIAATPPVPPIPTAYAADENEATLSEQELASVAGGQTISDEQIAVWLAILEDPKTPDDVRKRTSARVLGRPVDGKLYDSPAQE